MDSEFSAEDLRKMLGDNLRSLCKGHGSVSQICREIGVNRTQFNRYLAGESFPRPDVLYRICSFFKVDARILLSPINQIKPDNGLYQHPFIRDYLGTGAQSIPQEVFPNGFYSFSRRSFTEASAFLTGLVYVFRRDGYTFLRGYESKTAMRQQGLPCNAPYREFRGLVTPEDDGLVVLASHKGTMATSFNYLSRTPSFRNHYWSGYATRTVREADGNCRNTRMAFEHLGSFGPEVMRAARKTGFCQVDALDPYHRKLLKPDQPFA